MNAQFLNVDAQSLLVADAPYRLVQVLSLLLPLAPLHLRIIRDRDRNLSSSLLILCRASYLLKNTRRPKTNAILNIDGSEDALMIIGARGIILLLVPILGRLLICRLDSILMGSVSLNAVRILLRIRCRISFLDYLAVAVAVLLDRVEGNNGVFFFLSYDVSFTFLEVPPFSHDGWIDGLMNHDFPIFWQYLCSFFFAYPR